MFHCLHGFLLMSSMSICYVGEFEIFKYFGPRASNFKWNYVEKKSGIKDPNALNKRIIGNRVDHYWNES